LYPSPALTTLMDTVIGLVTSIEEVRLGSRRGVGVLVDPRY
jgi:hypothetical protein